MKKQSPLLLCALLLCAVLAACAGGGKEPNYTAWPAITPSPVASDEVWPPEEDMTVLRAEPQLLQADAFELALRLPEGLCGELLYALQADGTIVCGRASADTTIYINYTGRLLNGRVFDTTVADTAKMYGIYSSSKTYSPISVQYNHDDYTGITITSNKTSVIDGFSYMLWRMGPFEEGTGIFLSKLGYASSGSGSAIPAYSPLRFDIEVVEKP